MNAKALCRHVCRVASAWAVATMLCGQAHAQCDGAWVGNHAVPPSFPTTIPISALTWWDPDGGGPITELLVAGGTFTAVDGVKADRIAYYRQGAWHELAGGFPNPLGHGGVNALTVFDGDLYIGGAFNVSTPGGTALNIVRCEYDQGVLSFHAMGAGTDAAVNAFTTFEGKLIVGGTFQQADDETHRFVAAWDGSAWDHTANYDLDAAGAESPKVIALTVYDGKLVAGSNFAPSLHQWNGSSWSALDGGVYLQLEHKTLPGSVFALAVFGGELVVGGQFNRAGGEEISYLARRGSAGWSGFVSTTGRKPAGAVFTVAAEGDRLYTGGRFTVGTASSTFIARWEQSEWHDLGRGIPDGSVQAIAVGSGEVWTGGRFDKAGTCHTVNLARWSYAEHGPDLNNDGIVDFSDYLEFLNHFAAADSCADFTMDGIVDFSDYLAFLSSFDSPPCHPT